MLGAFLDGKMVGYCVFDIHTGDLTQIVVLSEYRRKGIASRLLQEVIARLKTDFIKVLNISSDNPTMPVFLKSKNIPLASKQFEMVITSLTIMIQTMRKVILYIAVSLDGISLMAKVPLIG